MENCARANFIFPWQMMFDIEKILSMYWEAATLNESNNKMPYKKFNKNANKNVKILHEWKESINVDKLLLVSIQGDCKEGYKNEKNQLSCLKISLTLFSTMFFYNSGFDFKSC
jgi:hypothetical protein